MTDLLDAVDVLTKPIDRKVLQPKDGELVTAKVTLPPLLDQLQEAILGTLGKESSKSLASERIPIDSDALFTFMNISSQIRDWARRVDAPVTTPTGTLRAWYVKWSQTVREPAEDNARVDLLSRWASQIRRKLDPPRVRDLPDPCPVCGAEEWWRDGSRYLRPLVVEYPQEVTPNLIQESRALCRACEQVWGVRELAYELEQAERHAVE